jgi:hypothetical protein
MKFVVRDDDICYFTKCEELENAWGWFWERFSGKVCFAVIPFVKTEEFISQRRYPLHENSELVNYLREKIKEKKAEILLHGYDHFTLYKRYEFESYDRGELSQKIRAGKRYLEEIFGVKVSFFVPPHNILSKAGLQAVKENELNILSSIPYNICKIGFRFENLSFFVKRRLFNFRHRKIFKKRYIYPFMVKFGSYTYLDCFNFNNWVDDMDNLIKACEIIARHKGIFCLSTHYWEMNEFKVEKLERLLRNIMSIEKIEFCFASEICKE